MCLIFQELGPKGVLEGEFVRVYFERISDCSVHDGLCPSSERGLNSSGLNELSLVLRQGKTNHANPFNV